MTDSVESVLQKSREEFEKWASAQEWTESDETKRDDAGLYKYSDVAYAWLAWQASRAALEPMLAELRKLKANECPHCGESHVEHYQDCPNKPSAAPTGKGEQG